MDKAKHDTGEAVKLSPLNCIKSKVFIVVNNNTMHWRHLAQGCYSNQLYCLNYIEIQVNRHLIFLI
jgi:hypothetical protein